MSCPPSITPDFSCGDGGGGGVQTVSGGTNITITGTPTDPIINASAGLVLRPSFTIYVAPNGNNTTADGSLSLPFQTIQGALNFRNGLSNTTNIEIFIQAGTYAENLTINTGNTYLYANHSPYKNFKTVIINGTVLVDITQPQNTGSCEVCFTNIQWPSSGITTGSSTNQGINIGFNNCSISGWFLHNQNFTQSCAVIYYDCYLQHTGTEALITSVGCNVQIFRCEMLHSNSTINPIINIQNGGGGGSGALNLQYTTIRSSTTSATAQPIIRYQNTSNSNQGNIMCYNTLNFSSQVVDTGNNKCCVQYNQTGAIIVEMMAFNTFDCDGASYTGGQPYAIQKRGAGTVSISVFGGNYGGQLAHKIDPAITRVSNMVLTG
jgi:hypothetical protein